MRKNHKSSFIRQLLVCCSPSYIFSTLYILCYMNEYSSLTKAQTHQQETTSYSQLRHACTQQACPSLSWILAHFLCHIIFQHHQASSLHQQSFTLTDQWSLLILEKFEDNMVSYFVFEGDELHNPFWASNHRKIGPTMPHTQRGCRTFEIPFKFLQHEIICA